MVLILFTLCTPPEGGGFKPKHEAGLRNSWQGEIPTNYTMSKEFLSENRILRLNRP